MYRKAATAVGLAAVLAGGLATTAGGQGNSATINLRDFSFGMGDTLPKGRTQLTFRNRGEFEHNFTIVYRSEGATAFRTRNVAPGRRLRRRVNLRPGAYVAVCTVFNGGHVAGGMYKRFTVGTLNRQTGQWE